MQRDNLLKVRQSIAVLEQFFENNKDEAKAYPEIPIILRFISALNQDQKPEDDSRCIELLRQELAKFLAKEPVLVANESIFEAAYYLQYACAKYWPKNLRDKDGKLLSYFTGNPINCPIFVAGTGYAYECNEDFFERTRAGSILYPTTMVRSNSSIIQPNQLLIHNLSIREKAYINAAFLQINKPTLGETIKKGMVIGFTTLFALYGYALGAITKLIASVFGAVTLSAVPILYVIAPILGIIVGGLVGFVAANVLYLIGSQIVSAISSRLSKPNPEAKPSSHSIEDNIALKTRVEERFVTGGKQIKSAIVLPKSSASTVADNKDEAPKELYPSLAPSPKNSPLRANALHPPAPDSIGNKPIRVPNSPRNGYRSA